ncbi:unnamed protein product [Cylicocyclus nassatus]|uniref:Uncharacterized protein n=1 Tax=Cylicocyclus nassatus TaxID=53992 RepID=A0AA36GRG7_CYLNA|nr:unnamed protein product [Cylicocyclus nassatus]
MVGFGHDELRPGTAPVWRSEFYLKNWTGADGTPRRSNPRKARLETHIIQIFATRTRQVKRFVADLGDEASQQASQEAQAPLQAA